MSYKISWYPTDGFDSNFNGASWTASTFDAAVELLQSRIRDYPYSSEGQITAPDNSVTYM